MILSVPGWLIKNYVEVIGAVSGLIYLYFSIRQKIWLWPWGIITSAFYICVFYKSSLYADMSLNIYYVLVSLYGWYNWVFGYKKEKLNDELPVTKLTGKGWLFTLLTIFLCWILLVYLLRKIPAALNIPVSEVASWDAFVTASSIVATFLLARKKIEQWLMWIVIDFISAGLFIYKHLYATVILFVIYATLAIFGYFEWKKDRVRS
jgi:nicotinamide mononucleotide transporter